MPPIHEIDDDTLRQNKILVKAADLYDPFDMPFGHQISVPGGCVICFRSVIIEDGDPYDRDFTGGTALAAYKELKKKAVTVNRQDLHEVLP
jgi:hypothetical protein